MSVNPLKIAGKQVVAYIRLLKNASKEQAALIPYQTSLDFDPQRKSDSTATKSGNVVTPGALELDLSIEFIDNLSKVGDDIRESLFKEEKCEVWIVYLNKKKDDKNYGIYMQGQVSEDSGKNDADSDATREASFAIDGDPQLGWLTLPNDAKEELSYAFRGLGKVEDGKQDDSKAYNWDTDSGTTEQK